MSTHAFSWITDRDGRAGVVPRIARHGATAPCEAGSTPTLGVWVLLGTIVVTKLAMAVAIVWAAPTAADAAILAVMARL